MTGELARLTARLVSLSDYLTGHVAAMPAEQWAAPDPETEAKVRLWQATAGQAGALLTALARLGIDLGREAREAEMERAQRRMAGWLSAKVDALLYELRLDARQRERIPDVVPAWIRWPVRAKAARPRGSPLAVVRGRRRVIGWADGCPGLPSP